MQIDQLDQTIGRGLDLCAQSVGQRYAVSMFPMLDLAKAWLEGTDGSWVKDHAPWMTNPETPKGLARQGYLPFSMGYFTKPYRRKPQTVISGRPVFFSPSTDRAQGAAAMVMQAWGRFGAHLETAYHEMGHYLERAMDIQDQDFAQTLDQRLVSECRADGFAIAFAVAQGADPAACVREVALYRASAVHSDVGFATEYFTLPFLPHAARIGLMARERRLDPAWIMQRLHQQVERVVDWYPAIRALEGRSLEALRRMRAPFYKQFVLHPIEAALKTQPAWTRQQETRWFNRLYQNNPTHAPVLRRMRGALALTNFVQQQRPRRARKSPPLRAEQVIPWVQEALSLSGRRSTSPKNDTVEAQIAAINHMIELLDHPMDTRTRANLAQLVDMVQRGRPPQEKAPKPLGWKVRPRQGEDTVLVDVCNQPMSVGTLHRVAEQLKTAPVATIAVVANTPQQARETAYDLRLLGDCLAAHQVLWTPSWVERNHHRLRAQVAAKQAWLVGPWPTIRPC